MNRLGLKNSADIWMWTDGVQVEHEAMQQLYNVAKLPFIFDHVSVMPDVHAGVGATIGTVVATRGAIVPSIAGVDLGCGMLAVQTNLRKEDAQSRGEDLFASIEKMIPHGRTNNGSSGDEGSWDLGNTPDDVLKNWNENLKDVFDKICKRHPGITPHNSVNHLGTLGSGNHFVEICYEINTHEVWYMIHSGSRGPGNRFGQFFIREAKKQAKINKIDLPHIDLAYFEESEESFHHYLEAAMWSQEFARLNRELMRVRVRKAIQSVIGDFVETKKMLLVK